MNTNDLINGFLDDPIAVRSAKGLVCTVFEISQQDFDYLLYGALTKAWQSWDEHRSKFNTHVITCLKSECLDYLRKENRYASHVEYADKVAVGISPERVMYMKTMLELLLDKIVEHEEGDMLFRILVCGDNYIAVSKNPAQARKIVERFRTSIKEEFGDIFS